MGQKNKSQVGLNPGREGCRECCGEQGSMGGEGQPTWPFLASNLEGRRSSTVSQAVRYSEEDVVRGDLIVVGYSGCKSTRVRIRVWVY